MHYMVRFQSRRLLLLHTPHVCRTAKRGGQGSNMKANFLSDLCCLNFVIRNFYTNVIREMTGKMH